MKLAQVQERTLKKSATISCALLEYPEILWKQRIYSIYTIKAFVILRKIQEIIYFFRKETIDVKQHIMHFIKKQQVIMIIIMLKSTNMLKIF